MTSSQSFVSDPSRHFEFPKINNPCLALDKATQTLFEIFKNPILFSEFERTSDRIIMSFSSPW